MMDSFSPFTRRLVAISIPVFVVLAIGSVIVLPVVDALSASREQLADDRFRASKLKAIIEAPTLPAVARVPRGLYISAPAIAPASAALANIITSTAARNQMAVDHVVAINGGGTDLALVDFAATGSEAGILSFLNELEVGSPLVRMQNVRLIAIEGQPRQLRVEGVAMAARGRGR